MGVGVSEVVDGDGGVMHGKATLGDVMSVHNPTLITRITRRNASIHRSANAISVWPSLIRWNIRQLMLRL